MIGGELAKKDVTVVLTGDAGDEFFGGYTIYDRLSSAQKMKGEGVLLHYLYKLPGVNKIKDFRTLPLPLKIAAESMDQKVKTQSGTGYYFDTLNYIRSFAGMFPKDDPEIIIYVATKKTYTQKGVSNIVKGLVKDIANYRSIFKNEETNSTTFKIDDYSNQNLMMVLDNLKDKFKDIVVIGDGDKIVDTYPKNKVVSKDEKIFILTNSKNIEIPDFIGYSKREVDTYKKLTGIDITLEGNGYVYEQNKEDDKIYLKLKDRYVEQKKNNEDT